jgi:type IV pilus assembly protein PilA
MGEESQMADPVRWQDSWWHQQPDGSWLRFNEQTQAWEPHRYVAAPSGMSGGAKAAVITLAAVGVIFVLAILAAIAIPVFLRQRERGWEAQVTSALKNAGTAQESHCARSPDCYTASTSALEAEGLTVPPDVTLSIVRADHSSYCMEARHAEMPDRVWSLDTEFGPIIEAQCL